MAFNVLYNDMIVIDELSLLKYINEFTKSLGETDVVVDPDVCRSILLGMRQDFPHTAGLQKYRKGKDRQWLGLGLQGLAPYWFEVDVTAYVGDNGRTALAAQAEYELLLTQRLILQPRAELNLYGKDDPENGLGSGLSDLALGVRLRYEYSRQFSPYIGVEWTGTYGDTADYRRAEGQNDSDTQIVAGLRFWF